MSSEKKTLNLGLELKEKDGEFYTTGFVSTTHPDRAADSELGVNGDILSKQVQDQIAGFINDGIATTNGVGSTRTCSLVHDWIKQNNPDLPPAGMARPPAKVKQLDGGHWGVEVETHLNMKHPKAEDTLYNIKHGYYPGYSIEYEPGEYSIIEHEGRHYRYLKTIKDFVGYAYATARKIANPAATITGFGYKEIESLLQKNELEKDTKEALMVEEETKKQTKEAEVKEEESAPAPEEEQAEEAPAQEAEEESEAPEQKEVDVKQAVESLSAEVKEALKEVKVQKKTLLQGEETMENINIKELNEALNKMDVFAYKEAADRYLQESVSVKESRVNTTLGLLKQIGRVQTPSNLDIKCDGKGLRIASKNVQVKATLGTGDNTSSFTQADVEFADLFAPGIIDTFNNQTNLFGFLRKEQHVGGEHYQWKIVTNKDPDSNATFVGHNDTSILKNYAGKINLQTPLKIARRGVSVTDFILRYSARSLGDLFQLELDLQMKEMLNDVNAALFAEVADGTGLSPLGLEAVADSAGNTTLYGLTRSTANRLSPDAAGDTYTAVGGALTEALMRAKITNLETEGVRFGDIAIVTSPGVRDFLFNLLDGNRRFNTAEATFGFNRANVPSYDGIPIIVDSDCNSDAMYFIDTSSDVIVVGMEPRIIELAKVGAATEAYVQMDFAHVYKQPRRIGMLDTLTS